MNLKKLLLRELKVMAGKLLGDKAARLKTKDELIAALEKVAGKAKAAKASPPKAAKASPPKAAKASPPKAAKASPPKAAKPTPSKEVKAAKPKLTPVSAAEVKPQPIAKPVTWTEPKQVAQVKPAVRPVKTSGAVATSKSVKQPLLRAVPELAPEPARAKPEAREAARATVTQDFFMLPGSVKLPQARGDDRVLVFAKDTGGLYTAWDFSTGTWAGGGAVLEVVDGAEEVLAQLGLDAPYGGRFVEVPHGPVQVRVRRGGQLLGQSAWLSLPRAKAGEGPRTRLKVKWGEPLPTQSRPVKSRRKVRAAQERAQGTSPSGPEAWAEEGWGEGFEVTSRV